MIYFWCTHASLVQPLAFVHSSEERICHLFNKIKDVLNRCLQQIKACLEKRNHSRLNPSPIVLNPSISLSTGIKEAEKKVLVESPREQKSEKISFHETPMGPPTKVEELEDLIMHKISSDFSTDFRSIKKENLWMLVFMERDRILKSNQAESGYKEAYEKEEKGYLKGILNGYLYMLQTLHEPLTAELYEKIHDASVEGVSSESEEAGIPKGFRKYTDGGEAFELVWKEKEGTTHTVSEQGLKELAERYRTYKYEFDGQEYYPLKEAMVDPKKTIDPTQKTRSFIKLKPTRPETCRANASFCIHLFEKAPKNTEAEKLLAAARLCQDLDQFHLFVDGNIRTTGILVLNKVLMQMGLSPCVMRDVNQLDCLSEAEIVQLIREGQAFFKELTGAKK